MAVQVDPAGRFVVCAEPHFLRLQRADTGERMVGDHDVAINIESKLLGWAGPQTKDDMIFLDVRQIGRSRRSSSGERYRTIWIQSAAGRKIRLRQRRRKCGIQRGAVLASGVTEGGTGIVDATDRIAEIVRDDAVAIFVSEVGADFG